MENNLLNFIPSLFNLKALTSSDIILLITGVIVLIYTRAAQRANELQTSPCIILSFEDITQPGNSNRDGKIRIKNIGKGPACDINILPFAVNEEEKTYTYTFYTEERVLKPEQEQYLQMWVKTPNGGVESSKMGRFLFRIIPEILNSKIHTTIQAERPATFTINYKGLNGKNYHSIYRLYSVLPPVGDIVMQSLHYGKRKAGLIKTRWYHLIKPTIPHEGNDKIPKSFLVKIFTFLHKKLHKPAVGN